jgi:hypothetical protein
VRSLAVHAHSPSGSLANPNVARRTVRATHVDFETLCVVPRASVVRRRDQSDP